jgi:hypothetical protein
MRRLLLSTALMLFASCSTHSDDISALSFANPSSFNAVFVDEWGPTAYNAAGTADGYNDCGPASLVMTVAARGVIPEPTAATAEAEIRTMRDLAHGGPTPMSEPTYGPMMLTALDAEKLDAVDLMLSTTATELDDDVTSIEQAIADHCIVLVAGDPGNAWGRGLDAMGDYLHHYGTTPADDSFGHWVVVFGKDPSGTYILGDPLAEGGVIEVTPAQLETYLSDGGTQSGAIRVYPLSS